MNNAVRTKQKMPKGTFALLLTQLFSTLSFSVLYSTLVLYATKSLHLSDSVSTSIIATFVAFNYALHLLGGYAGGRYLSYRSLFCTGMVLIIIGCGLIAVDSINMLYWGLAFFLTGAGVNVTCINCMLTQLFEPNDTRRETAFLWNYSGMNVGFLIGFSMAGSFQIHHAYRELFGLSAIGNVLALAIVAFNWYNLRDINTHLTHCKKTTSQMLKAALIIVLLVLGLRWMFAHAGFSGQVVMSAGVIMAGILIYLALKQPQATARRKMWAYMILAVSSLVFWAIYQLIPMGLTLFIARNVDRTFHGFLIPPQWFENINGIIIIIGGPLLAHVFQQLRQRGVNVNIPVQFSAALVLIGLAMFMLKFGILFAGPKGYVPMYWPMACYALLTLGELFISPIGYAMVGQLAPTKLRGIMMGTWLMLTGISATVSSLISKRMLGHHTVTSPLVTNPTYSDTFTQLAWIAIAVAIVLFSMAPLLRRLIDSDNELTSQAKSLDTKPSACINASG
ncbi:MAG: oligopeptide:H+ symporter [Coxiellaceae bacterium]|nr:oligopeptide:H+ symporter [Coxiellaceae bacterium]